LIFLFLCLGIIHFAGITHGNALLLCENPFMNPLLLTTSVVPLYYSIIMSFLKKVSNVIVNNHTSADVSQQKEQQSSLKTILSDFQICIQNLELVKNYLRVNKVKVNYNAGLGKFVWPPLT
jgi:hypothetical protein